MLKFLFRLAFMVHNFMLTSMAVTEDMKSLSALIRKLVKKISLKVCNNTEVSSVLICWSASDDGDKNYLNIYITWTYFTIDFIITFPLPAGPITSCANLIFTIKRLFFQLMKSTFYHKVWKFLKRKLDNWPAAVYNKSCASLLTRILRVWLYRWHNFVFISLLFLFIQLFFLGFLKNMPKR